ncbi:hypothetical protein GJ496_006741 [Pomphorhynchus laevis]|nr:hypothetical protein GJ496_006741 [Pomphorhynchus laevis]
MYNRDGYAGPNSICQTDGGKSNLPKHSIFNIEVFILTISYSIHTISSSPNNDREIEKDNLPKPSIFNYQDYSTNNELIKKFNRTRKHVYRSLAVLFVNVPESSAVNNQHRLNDGLKIMRSLLYTLLVNCPTKVVSSTKGTSIFRICSRDHHRCDRPRIEKLFSLMRYA